MNKHKYLLILLIILWNHLELFSQQVPDSLYRPEINNKMYPNEGGSIIYIDEGHNNFHTKDGRYYSFTKLLEQDGYQVESYSNTFSNVNLKEVDILVIANALADSIRQPITTPTRSAFSKDEIKSLANWVKNGGALFLIGDHMPFAGAATELANEFGFKFYDSFVMYNPENGIIDFSKQKGTLSDNLITQGRNSKEEVNQVRTFTGQGFKIPKEAKSILNLDESQTVFLVDTMWVFNDRVERFSASELSQGAIMNIEKGRVAFFGEAAMFSAQLAGPRRQKVGMNSENAKENFQLLLNVIHWLDGKLGKEN